MRSSWSKKDTALESAFGPTRRLIAPSHILNPDVFLVVAARTDYSCCGTLMRSPLFYSIAMANIGDASTMRIDRW